MGREYYLLSLFPNTSNPFNRVKFGDYYNYSKKLKEIVNSIDINWSSWYNAFGGLDSLTISAIDTPDLSKCN